MAEQEDSAEKSHEASPRKLEEARKKGEIPRAPDLLTGFAYLGMLLCLLAVGSWSVSSMGDGLMPLVEQPDRLAALFFSDGAQSISLGLIAASFLPALPLLLVPGCLVLLCLLATRGLLFTPSKLTFKASRISPVDNAKNKFGRRGLFEFFKSFVKLMVYSICLAVFLQSQMQEIVGSVFYGPGQAARTMVEMIVDFLVFVVVIAMSIGLVDYLWQRAEHLRKNRMSQKEMRDEFKESDGDPMFKQHRRARGQEIAMSQMMQDVPKADVVIVNPTHFAVALTWSRMAGEAPVCVAKGQDSVALKIREIATEAGVPIHSDPPTARALFATTEIGSEISPDHYKPVAAAIRFAQDMRAKARQKGWT
jgi:flagellar biosynthetic protein FlhB